MSASVDLRRVVAYARVSRLSAADRERGDGKSVDQQLDALRVIAEREGVQVIAEFRDDGISASRYAKAKAREGWRSTMEAILDGEIDELWVWELSRATRDRPVWAALFGACAAQDVKITVNGRVHDPNDPDDAFMLDLNAALAVKESAMTSNRIKRDVASRAAKGLPHGRIPFGYRRVYDERTRVLLRQEPDPETAPIVAELARRVLAGEALYSLAREMNERGVPSPETTRKRKNGDTQASFPWRPDQVRNIIENPSAAGLRTHRGRVLADVVASWDPIITRGDHFRIVERFSDPTRRTWTDASAKHLLTGLAVCGVCGGEIRRIKNRGTPSYSCVGRRHGSRPTEQRFCVARKIEPVDELVRDVIVARLSRPDVLDLFAPDNGEDDTAAARTELADLRAEHSQLLALAEAGKVSVAAFARLEPALLERMTAAERRAIPAQAPPLIVDLAGAVAGERWEALALEQRREIVRQLCTVKIHRARSRGSRTFDPTTIEIDWHRS